MSGVLCQMPKVKNSILSTQKVMTQFVKEIKKLSIFRYNKDISAPLDEKKTFYSNDKFTSQALW